MCSLVWFIYWWFWILFAFQWGVRFFLANNPNKFFIFFIFIIYYVLGKLYFFYYFTNEFANQLGERGGFCNTFRGVIPKNNPQNLPERNVAVKKSHSNSTRSAQLYEVAKIRSYHYLYCFTYHSSFPLLCFIQVSHLCFFALFYFLCYADKLYLGMVNHPNVVLFIGFSEGLSNFFLI